MAKAYLIAEIDTSCEHPSVVRVTVSEENNTRIGFVLNAVLLEREAETPEKAYAELREELHSLALQWFAWRRVEQFLEAQDRGLDVRSALFKVPVRPAVSRRGPSAYDLSDPRHPARRFGRGKKVV